MKIQSKKLRDSARGEACTVNVLGACNYDESTTVLAHLPSENKGMGIKSDDICACFACSACHDVLDSRRQWPGTEGSEASWYMLRANMRTMRRWLEMGLISIAGAKR